MTKRKTWSKFTVGKSSEARQKSQLELERDRAKTEKRRELEERLSAERQLREWGL